MKNIPIKSSFFQFQRYSDDEIKLSDEATIVGFGEQSNTTPKRLMVRMNYSAQDNGLFH
jgi:hypothetical protein